MNRDAQGNVLTSTSQGTALAAVQFILHVQYHRPQRTGEYDGSEYFGTPKLTVLLTQRTAMEFEM